jgi:hypothetical protein
VSNPYGPPPDPPAGSGGIRGWVVVTGIVVGLVGTFVWMAVVFVVALSQENRPDQLPGVVVFVLLVLPLPMSILLLCFRRTRQAAAGLVMGVAIGTLVLAGLCGGLVALPALGA